VPIVVVLILLIGINNLLLGYALAVWMGYGPTSGVVADFVLQLWPAGVPAAPDARLPEPIAPLMPKRRPAPTTETTLPEVGPAASQPIAMLVHDLNRAVLNSAAKMTDMDRRIRALHGQYDLATVGQCVADVLAECESYLTAQSQALEQLHGPGDAQQALGPLAEQIELANLELSAQIETVTGHLRHMSLQSDAAITAERLLSEVHELRVAWHRLRDQQDQSFLAAVQSQGTLAAIDAPLKTDALTALPNCLGITERLEQWWAERGSRPLVAALVDLDAFGTLNKDHGWHVGDRILIHVGRCLSKTAGGDMLVGRYFGPRFLVAARDAQPADLASGVQRVRQALEQTTFSSNGRTFGTTLSAATSDAGPNEAPADFLKRLDLTLAEARTSGPNQVYLCSDGQIQPAGPLPSEASPQVVEL
jgi:diguanylate cyclase (GGDEF)-like protein